MDSKNQTILETFVQNLLASTSAEQRNVSVEKACGGDEEMRALVTALLNASPGGSDPVPLAGQTLPVDADAQDPAAIAMRIGNYTLLEKLGAGSFGIVYLAEQVTPVQRRVALKLLKQGIDSWTLLERFKMESQALALMDHPNIAKVLDAGTTISGRPYFVMELVQGIPITTYCDERGLDCRKRLELMIPVCKAIQHAHQKGIVHRDIKPSNALVTLRDDVPAPMVIDFGVAKAVRQGLLGPSDLTECHQIVGTPAYMSPEQVGLDGIDIDTRSDIYSLGVLLYELLTGTTPFSESEYGYTRRDEIFRLIREVDPPKPSARVSSKGNRTEAARNRGMDPASLARLLHGDLDWIVMKCLEKDRSRRYETANGLALDIGRFLKCEPVLASPPSMVYRLRKFALRRMGTVIVSMSVAITLAAALVTSLVLLGSYRERAIEVLRLSDLDVIDHLNNAYSGLTRIDYRRRHAAMAIWVDRAREVLSRRASHRATLEKLRRSGTRVASTLGAPTSTAQQSTPDGREPWRFADTPTQWQHDLLQKLVARLDDLQGKSDKLARV
jgi:serine/threonine protein kinase